MGIRLGRPPTAALLAIAVACADAPPPNVLVIVLDDVGVDGVAAYGLHPDPPTTPTLDALASSGVRFDRAYATPLCGPSRAALLTGRYGRRTGFGNNLPFHGAAYELEASEFTLPELVELAPTPYGTFAAGKWHLANENVVSVERSPIRLGFDGFGGTLANLTAALDDSDGLEHDYWHWEEVDDGVVTHLDGYNTTHVVDTALERLARLEEPWLAYVAIHSAHDPSHLPPPHLHTTDATETSPKPDLWAAMVESADTEIARLLAGIAPDVLLRTTVIVTGDNGTDESNVREPWDLPGAKGTLYDGGVRVPLIVTGASVGDPGGVSDALVHIADIFPTVAEVAGYDEPYPHPTDGRSLMPYLLDSATPGGRAMLYTELLGPSGSGPYTSVDKRMVTDGSHKLIVDALLGTETLHATAPSPDDESEDLLADGVSAEEAAVLEALRAFHDGTVADLEGGR